MALFDHSESPTYPRRLLAWGAALVIIALIMDWLTGSPGDNAMNPSPPAAKANPDSPDP